MSTVRCGEVFAWFHMQVIAFIWGDAWRKGEIWPQGFVVVVTDELRNVTQDHMNQNTSLSGQLPLLDCNSGYQTSHFLWDLLCTLIYEQWAISRLHPCCFIMGIVSSFCMCHTSPASGLIRVSILSHLFFLMSKHGKSSAAHACDGGRGFLSDSLVDSLDFSACSYQINFPSA